MECPYKASYVFSLSYTWAVWGRWVGGWVGRRGKTRAGGGGRVVVRTKGFSDGPELVLGALVVNVFLVRGGRGGGGFVDGGFGEVEVAPAFWEVHVGHADGLEDLGKWVGGWVGGLGRGERGGSNVLLEAVGQVGGWVGGWVGVPNCLVGRSCL